MNTNQRIEVVDLLRGLSCLGVLLYHVRVDLWIGWWRITSYPQEYSAFAKAMAWLSIPTPFLGYAILLFFLISGFCIHFPNTEYNKAAPSWKTYFIRRFWRIYPTYLVAVIITSIISYYCHVNWGDPTWDTQKILRVATVSQNYPPNNGQFLSNPSLWTIPLEIEFYALYPLAFFFFTKFKSILLLLTVSLGISGLCVYLASSSMQWLSFTAFFLWPSWLLGTWVASLHRFGKIHSINLTVLIAGSVISLIISLLSRLNNWDSWLQYAFWTAFYFFLFILFLKCDGFFHRARNFFLIRGLAWIGKISFSLYLIHFPLFKLFGYLHQEIFEEKPANFLTSLLYILPVILFAWLFFKCVEDPIHQWSKKKRKR